MEATVTTVKNTKVTITDTEFKVSIIFDNLPHLPKPSTTLQDYLKTCAGAFATYNSISFTSKSRPYVFVKLHIAAMAYPFLGRSPMSSKVMFMGQSLCEMSPLHPLMFEPNIKATPGSRKCHIEIRGSYEEFDTAIKMFRELVGDTVFNKFNIPVDLPNPVMPDGTESKSPVFPYSLGVEGKKNTRVIDRYYVVVDPDTMEVRDSYLNTDKANQYEGDYTYHDIGIIGDDGKPVTLIPTGAGTHWYPVCDKDLILSIEHNRTPGNMEGCTFSAVVFTGASVSFRRPIKRTPRFEAHTAFCKKYEVSSVAEYVYKHIMLKEIPERLKMLAEI